MGNLWFPVDFSNKTDPLNIPIKKNRYNFLAVTNQEIQEGGLATAQRVGWRSCGQISQGGTPVTLEIMDLWWIYEKLIEIVDVFTGWWLSPTPLKNMSSSVGMMIFPVYGKNVPNHQLVSIVAPPSTIEIDRN